MARILDLAEIQALGAGGAYEGTFTLSGESAALCLSWLALLQHVNWEGASYELTAAEKDDIDAMVALTLLELMEENMPDGTPLGAIIWTCTTDGLDDYIHCVGGNYDRVDYPDLYAALDDVYIVDVDTFTVPDLHSRVVIGDGKANAYPDRDIGDEGGEQEVTLTTTEMPGHSHNIRGRDTAGGSSTRPAMDSTGDYSIFTSETAGSGQAHENMPPFHVIRPFIKAR